MGETNIERTSPFGFVGARINGTATAIVGAEIDPGTGRVDEAAVAKALDEFSEKTHLFGRVVVSDETEIYPLAQDEHDRFANLPIGRSALGSGRIVHITDFKS